MRAQWPQYVNMTHFTFVCTTCSGIQYERAACPRAPAMFCALTGRWWRWRCRSRSLNHRIKGISMSQWTDTEVEELEKAGNEVRSACRSRLGCSPSRALTKKPPHTLSAGSVVPWLSPHGISGGRTGIRLAIPSPTAPIRTKCKSSSVSALCVGCVSTLSLSISHARSLWLSRTRCFCGRIHLCRQALVQDRKAQEEGSGGGRQGKACRH